MVGRFWATDLLGERVDCIKAEALLPHSKGLHGEGFGEALWLREGLGERDVF